MRNKYLYVVSLMMLTSLSAVAQNFAGADLPSLALTNAKGLDAGDYDNDGDLDLLVRWYDATATKWKVEIFRNTSTVAAISFVSTGIVLLDVSGDCIWADLNNDSKLDIIASGNDGVNFLRAYINQSGAYSTIIPISTDLATAIDWGDVDADGDKDLLITNATESFILTRTNQNTFTRLLTDSFSLHSALVDYDLDYDLDVVGDGIYSNKEIEFLETHALFPTPSGYSNFGNTYAADLDGDGDRDLLRAERSTARGSVNYMAVAYFNENNIFTRVEIESIDDFTAGPILPLGAFDTDNDGDAEMAYAVNGNRPDYFVRFKEVNSGLVTTISLPPSSRFHSLGAHSIADFNGDQKLDIIQSGSYVNTSTGENVVYAKAFRNVTATPNSKPTPPANLKTTIGDNGVTLSWDKPTDDKTPGPSINYNFYLRQGLDTLVSPYATKSGKPRVNALKGSFESSKALLPNLPNGSYYWAVQSIDLAGNYSAFTQETNFEVTGGDNINHSTGLTDQSICYDRLSDQFILVGVSNGNIYGVLLDGKFGERTSGLIKLNQFSGTCLSPKVTVDSTGNYLVTWIGDSTTLPKSLWGKFIKSDLSSAQLNESRVCEKVFYDGSNHPIINHDVRFNPARNAFDVAWVFSGSISGMSARRVRWQANTFTPEPIRNISWTYTSGFLHGARGHLSVSMDSDPTVGKSLVVYAYEDTRADAPLTSLGKIYFRKLNLDLTVDGDSVMAATFTTGSEPNVRYNPYLKNFMVTWNAHFQHQITILPQDGYNESRDVAAAILSFTTGGALDTYIFPATISKTQQQGGAGGALSSNLSFNYKRNEFLVSWFNTNTDRIYAHRINPIDKVTVTADEYLLEESISEFPQSFFADQWNHFLLGFKLNGIGTTRLFEMPRDTKPQVVSLTTDKGYAGDKIIILGNSFGKTPFLNAVYFGSIRAKVDTVFWDKTKIQVTVPTGLTREKVPVTVIFDDQISNATVLFENISSTSVTSVAPLVGALGEVITIKGTNFPTNPADFQVKFGDTTALLGDIVSNSVTEIKVKVPQAAARGSGQTVGVVIQGVLNIYAGGTFRVIRPPVIESVVADDNFISKTDIIINGTDFSENLADMIVKLGSTVLTESDFKPSNGSQLAINIPNGVEGNLPITIFTDDRLGTSPSNYTFILGSEIESTVQASEFKFTSNNNVPIDFGVEVYNGKAVQELKFWTKGISESGSDWKSRNLILKDNGVTFKMSDAEFTDDPVGLHFFYEALDFSGIKKYSDTLRIRRYYSDSTNLIPNLVSGGNVADYQIVSIPYELDIKKINSVFKDLFNAYGYDKSKWRIIHYEASASEYKEYLEGLDEVSRGKGYWLISRYPQDIFFEGARSLRDDENGYYEIKLLIGWNQIGNPYNFNVSWTDVMSFNGNPAAIESFKTFKDGTFQVGTSIDRFRGGFIYAGSAFDLKIPVTQNKGINGGRTVGQKPFISNLSGREWRLGLELKAGEIRNTTGSFGMHPQSVEGEDPRDEHRLPDFIHTLDLSFPGSLSTSVVGTDESYTWEFEILNTTESTEVTLRWDNTSFGANDKELYLHDRTEERLINMREKNSYKFTYRPGYTFNLHFGDRTYVERKAIPEQIVLSDAYPNPMGTKTTIPFTVIQNNTQVQLSIYTLQGQEIRTLVNESLPAGFYEYEWDGKSTTGKEFSGGIVMYRLQTSSSRTGVQSVNKKLIIAP